MNLNDENLKSIVAKAIIDSITPESREKLIQDSITSILTSEETTSAYGRTKSKSPLQKAFDESVITYAQKYANEILENDQDFKSKIEILFQEVSKKLFEDQREELVDGIVRMIRNALTKDRY